MYNLCRHGQPNKSIWAARPQSDATFEYTPFTLKNIEVRNEGSLMG